MAGIWAKLMIKDKIVKDCLIKVEEYYDLDEFTMYVQDICYKFDIPNPIILSTHFNLYSEFNHVKFIKDDFVEDFNYDKLVLEKT